VERIGTAYREVSASSSIAWRCDGTSAALVVNLHQLQVDEPLLTIGATGKLTPPWKLYHETGTHHHNGSIGMLADRRLDSPSQPKEAVFFDQKRRK